MALFVGDLNARQFHWGEKVCNLFGEELVQITDHFTIVNDSEPTFLAADGSSVLDPCIFYGPTFDRINNNLSTNDFSELFSGPDAEIGT